MEYRDYAGPEDTEELDDEVETPVEDEEESDD